MRTAFRIVIVFIVILLGAAAARTYQPPRRANGPPVTLKNVSEALQAHRLEALNATSVERYPEFSMAFVEFDDGGNFSTDQVVAAYREVKATLDASPDALFLLYVHGWGHSAAADDRDVQALRETLCALKGMPELSSRKITAIYVGWRGKSARGKLHWLTFAFRSTAARQLGMSKEVNDVLGALSSLIDSARAPHRKITAVAIGHSLGGKFLFVPPEEKLKDNEEHKIAHPAPNELTPFGDITLLLNPAQDVHDYERFEAYADKHRDAPLKIITIASEADSVIGWWFRVGRVLNPTTSWFNFTGERTGLGWRAKQITHLLCLRDDTEALPRRSVCRSDNPERGEILQDVGKADLIVRGKAKREGPFMLVRADPRLIRNHSDIFNERFRTTLRELIAWAGSSRAVSGTAPQHDPQSHRVPPAAASTRPIHDPADG